MRIIWQYRDFFNVPTLAYYEFFYHLSIWNQVPDDIHHEVILEFLHVFPRALLRKTCLLDLLSPSEVEGYLNSELSRRDLSLSYFLALFIMSTLKNVSVEIDPVLLDDLNLVIKMNHLVIKMNLDLIGDLDEFSLFCFLYISHHRLHDLGFTNQEKKSLLRFLLMILRNGDESQYPIYAVAQELSKKILLEKVSLREEFAEFRLYISFSNFPEDMREMVRRLYI